MRERLHEVTRLGEATPSLSRDSRHLVDKWFITLAPNPEHSPVVHFRPSYEALDNWISRGNVGDELKGFHVSL